MVNRNTAKTQGYEAYVTPANSNAPNTIQLKIDGVNCAACIQKIESLFSDRDNVSQARLNFSTGALRLEWDGTPLAVNDYIDDIQSLGYNVSPFEGLGADDDTYSRYLLLCLGVAGFAAGNIMLLSFGLWITNTEAMGEGVRQFLHWITALIGIPALIFSGRPFFASAWDALKNKRTNMDVPISLALILASGMSVHELLVGADHVYFDSAVMLTFFLLIGRYLDFKARRKARASAMDLMSSFQIFAMVLDGKKTKTIPVKDLRPGMVVRVAAGETIPADGVIKTGKTDIDTSLVTGETVPKALQKGNEVFAGMINMAAPITMTVSKPAKDSLLADIVRLMEKAEQGQAQYVRLADRVAKLYTPVVHLLALAAFILWFVVLDAAWQQALLVAVTVLIITCPCALGLAVPVAQVLSVSQLMKQKILVKSGDALERLASITHIFTDKTGTLTLGQPQLAGDYDPKDLKLAASLATHSAHPLSQAIAKSYDGDLFAVKKIKEIPGSGIEAVIEGQKVQLGKQSWCGPKDTIDQSQTQIWMKAGKDKTVAFTVEDTLRPDAQEVIRGFQRKDIVVDLISGDAQSVVNSIAHDLEISNAQGGLTPPEKFQAIEIAKTTGAKTLMIGDGLNDAPVLAAADVSIAPGSAIDMAQNVADIVFMGDSFAPVGQAHQMAIKTQKIIKQNFAIAAIYNVFAVPVAFMGFVTPMIAAIAMSGSSILVILNSFRLRLRQ